MFSSDNFLCYSNYKNCLMQMIHFLTMALGGEGYLNFMGNEVTRKSTLASYINMASMFSEDCIELMYTLRK